MGLGENSKLTVCQKCPTIQYGLVCTTLLLPEMEITER